jgi:chromosome partitioning protein
MRVIAISNQKGGVGKTTTAINLASALTLAGQRVLLVDMDPQGNASSGVGLHKNDAAMGIADVLLGFRDLSSVRVPTAFDDLHLAPATRQLVGVDVEMVDADRREMRLRDALRDVDGEYDYVVLDCPPSLNLLTVNALTAAHGVLIPLQAEYFAMEGLTELLSTVQAVRRGLNPKLVRLGILLTMVDQRTNLSRAVTEQARQVFGEEVFKVEIPRNVRLAEAPSHGKPILAYDPAATGAAAYLDLSMEVILRCAALDAEDRLSAAPSSVIPLVPRQRKEAL